MLVGGCFGEPPDVDTGGASATSTSSDADSSTSAGTTNSESTHATTAVTTEDEPVVSTGPTTGSSGVVQTSDDGSDTTSSAERLAFSIYESLCFADIRSYQSPTCGGMDCQTSVRCDGQPAAFAGRALRLDPGETEGNGEASRMIELATYAMDEAFITVGFDSVSLEGLGAPRLRTTVWCGIVDPCQAGWRIEVQDQGGQIVAADEGVQIIDGAGAEVDLDLGPAAGAAVRILLRMDNNASTRAGDAIRFADPRVVEIIG